jgi:hypothetical protein
MFIFNEAMHLLPQSFVVRAPHSSSQGRLREQRHSSSQLLFGSFRKPAAPPPAAGFFDSGPQLFDVKLTLDEMKR